MKRKVIFGAVVISLICVCIALNSKILEPTDFNGTWYRAGDGVLYIFEDGLIKCSDHEVIILGDTVFSGAYSFAKDKAAIFVADKDGVSDIIELHLIHRPDGDILCEKKDGTDIVWFCRNRDKALKK